jgi:hypothetical protein
MCRDVARWSEVRGGRHLTIVPAESHPSGALRRITYESADGVYRASGIDAVARALEHIHLGWALGGCVIGLPPTGPRATARRRQRRRPAIAFGGACCL